MEKTKQNRLQPQYLNWVYTNTYKIKVFVKLKQDWWSGLPERHNLLPSGWGLRLTPNICRRSGSRKRKGMLETCNRLGCCFSEESEGWSWSCWEPSVCATSSTCWKTHKHSSVSSYLKCCHGLEKVQRATVTEGEPLGEQGEIRACWWHITNSLCSANICMWRWRLRKLSGSVDTDLKRKKLWHGETRECIYWAAAYKDLRENGRGREKVSVKMVCSSVHHVEEMVVTQLCSRMDCCPWHTFIFHLTSPDAPAFIPFSLFISLSSELHKTSSDQPQIRCPVMHGVQK